MSLPLFASLKNSLRTLFLMTVLNLPSDLLMPYVVCRVDPCCKGGPPKEDSPGSLGFLVVWCCLIL